MIYAYIAIPFEPECILSAFAFSQVWASPLRGCCCGVLGLDPLRQHDALETDARQFCICIYSYTYILKTCWYTFYIIISCMHRISMFPLFDLICGIYCSWLFTRGKKAGKRSLLERSKWGSKTWWRDDSDLFFSCFFNWRASGSAAFCSCAFMMYMSFLVAEGCQNCGLLPGSQMSGFASARKGCTFRESYR